MNRWMTRDDRTQHQYFEDRLSPYLDGELSPQEQDAVDRHLATCQACQWDLGTLRQTIQWMRELPQVPVPRVFTIQVPAPQVREPRRRWNFLPLLQGATALVALLLVFVVAGDFLIGRPGGMSMPEPMAVMQEAAEAPAPAMLVLTESITIIETVEVEKEVVLEVEAPAEEKALMAPTSAPAEAQAEVAATVPAEAVAREPAPEADTGLGAGEGTVTDEAPLAAAPPGSEPPAEPQAEEGAVAGGGPTPTPAPTTTLLPTEAYPVDDRNALAEAEAPLLGAQPWSKQVPGTPPRWPFPGNLRLVEYLLIVALVLLAATTLFVMINRRRSG